MERSSKSSQIRLIHFIQLWSDNVTNRDRWDTKRDFFCYMHRERTQLLKAENSIYGKVCHTYKTEKNINLIIRLADKRSDL